MTSLSPQARRELDALDPAEAAALLAERCGLEPSPRCLLRHADSLCTAIALRLCSGHGSLELCQECCNVHACYSATRLP